jgi:hypothetical protein
MPTTAILALPNSLATCGLISEYTATLATAVASRRIASASASSSPKLEPARIRTPLRAEPWPKTNSTFDPRLSI